MKDLRRKIEQILRLEPIYTKPGLSERASKEIEIIHKRDELLFLLEDTLKLEKKKIARRLKRYRCGKHYLLLKLPEA